MNTNVKINNDYNTIDIIINIIIGLIIGIIASLLLFKKTIYKGPNSNNIIHKQYNDEKGIYKWEPVITICPLGTNHSTI